MEYSPALNVTGAVLSVSHSFTEIISDVDMVIIIEETIYAYYSRGGHLALSVYYFFLFTLSMFFSHSEEILMMNIACLPRHLFTTLASLSFPPAPGVPHRRQASQHPCPCPHGLVAGVVATGEKGVTGGGVELSEY